MILLQVEADYVVVEKLAVAQTLQVVARDHRLIDLTAHRILDDSTHCKNKQICKPICQRLQNKVKTLSLYVHVHSIGAEARSLEDLERLVELLVLVVEQLEKQLVRSFELQHEQTTLHNI